MAAGVGFPVSTVFAEQSAVAPTNGDDPFVASGPLADSWSESTPGGGAGELEPLVAEQLVGGSLAASGEFPWMTFLAIETVTGDFSQCGGSLIAPRWVLTAAHCVDDAVAVAAITGRTAAPTSLSDPAFVFAARTHIRAEYVPSQFGVGDVALVELSEASSAQTIYLATPGDVQLYTAGTMAMVAGWGVTAQDAPSSDVLLTGELPIRSNLDCLAAHRAFDSTFNTCAGYSISEASQPVGSCSGDSGGPLFVQSANGQAPRQVGIVSYGVGQCTTLTDPGVYMRVSAFYDVIDNLVGGLSAPPTPPAVTVERWAGADRYATSVRISQEAFPAGADAVFLATGQSFPDALAAGPAAASLNAPILLTATNQLPLAVVAELKRLNPSVVYLLGGPAAIASGVETQIDAVTSAETRRIAGNDRYTTAAAVTAFAFSVADVVYVAAGTGFADALSAGAPGGVLRRPVLLTANNLLPAASRAQVTRLANPDIVVLGGTAAVSNTVVAELDSLTTGTVRRVNGANRYATSVAVSADAFAAADTVFLATGTAFPDALGAAPAAIPRGAPILLTTPACAPVGVIAEVTRLGADRVIALGGLNAVSNAAANLTPCPVTAPTPTPPPPDPAPQPPAVTLQPGTTLIGSGAPAGRYIARASTGCYWERLSGLGGTLGEIIANDFQPFAGPAIVDIRPTDLAFNFDAECGSFKTYAPPTTPSTVIRPGAWVVGADIQPGTYSTTASDGCYWERATSFNGLLSSIIANDFLSSGGPAFVTIAPTDTAFKTDADCGTWTRVG